MLKGDIVEQLCEDMKDLTKADAVLAVDIILETMTKGLVNGQRIEIRGFGSLSPRQRQPKTAKNPKSGAIMHIPLRNTLHFTMSKSLKYPLIKK
jgi:integration host factor subunit beta